MSAFCIPTGMPTSHTGSATPCSHTGSDPEIILVGAGPGDPDLISVAGARAIARADVIVYDYLANAKLLEWASPSAARIYVGKKGFSHHITQEDIQALLCEKAAKLKAAGGGCLVRLKGGDPFVFGRGGEEALALIKAGFTYRVIPGITAGIAGPALAGIPVTHRFLSSSVAFVTGNEDPHKEVSSLNWAALAKGCDTLCVYMGVHNLDKITHKLLAAGRPLDTPAVLIRWASLPEQELLCATLADIASQAKAAHFQAPALLVVGQVASLHEKLISQRHVMTPEVSSPVIPAEPDAPTAPAIPAMPSVSAAPVTSVMPPTPPIPATPAEQAAPLPTLAAAPLLGKTIVVTRARTQASTLASRLCALGAHVVELPSICIRTASSYTALDWALNHIKDYQWLAFTSVNGVESFFARLDTRGLDARACAGVRIGAIGPATAASLAAHGIKADVVPKAYRGEALAEALIEAGAKAGDKVLLPRAAQAREVLVRLLKEKGIRVVVVEAYRIGVPELASVRGALEHIAKGEVDGITFTSSSTVRNFLALVNTACEQPSTTSPGISKECLGRLQCYSIGPITSQVLLDAGLHLAAEAQRYTIDGLVKAIVASCSIENSQSFAIDSAPSSYPCASSPAKEPTL